MKELSIEEKAKRYDEALERAKEQLDGAKVFDYKEKQIAHDVRTTTYAIFPELKESEDEKIIKWLIEGLRNSVISSINNGFDIDMGKMALAWLEKQGDTDETINSNEFAQGVFPNILWHGVDEEPEEQCEILCEWESKDAVWHDVAFYHADTKTFWNGAEKIEAVVRWIYVNEILENQGEQKPAEEYNITGIGSKNAQGKLGEMINNLKPVNEVLEQKSADNIIPIFKTGNVIKNKKNGDTVTIEEIDEKHQHYCYKGWDGAATIHSDFSISEQDDWELVEQKPTDKVEHKFHEGEWLCENEPNNYARFIQILETVNVQGKERYKISRNIHNDEDIVEFDFVEKYYHKFDIKDAKDGDVLVHNSFMFDDFIFIYNSTSTLQVCCYYSKKRNRFIIEDRGHHYPWNMQELTPATKEQREQLEKAMADAGFTFDFDKKELMKIEQKPAWSEEDEEQLRFCCAAIELSNYSSDEYRNYAISFLESLKDRVGNFDDGYKVGFSAAKHNQWKPSDEQMQILQWCMPLWSEPKTKAVLESLIADLKKL